MSVNLDDDWAKLSDEWRAQRSPAAVPEALFRQVQRQTRRMNAILAVEIVLTCAALAFLAAGYLARPGGEVTVLAVALLVHTVGVWAFVLHNRRGTWRPYAQTAEAFRELARRRAERTRRSATFVLWISSAWFVAIGAIAWWRAAQGLLTPARVAALSVSGTWVLCMAAGAAWYRRRAGARAPVEDEDGETQEGVA